MEQTRRGQARVTTERTRWMDTQPEVNLDEDVLEQMLLLEVYLLRHVVIDLQVFRLISCSAQDQTTSLGSVLRSEDRMEREI
jgi:hypothetical protein